MCFTLFFDLGLSTRSTVTGHIIWAYWKLFLSFAGMENIQLSCADQHSLQKLTLIKRNWAQDLILNRCLVKVKLHFFFVFNWTRFWCVFLMLCFSQWRHVFTAFSFLSTLGFLVGLYYIINLYHWLSVSCVALLLLSRLETESDHEHHSYFCSSSLAFSSTSSCPILGIVLYHPVWLLSIYLTYLLSLCLGLSWLVTCTVGEESAED